MRVRTVKQAQIPAYALAGTQLSAHCLTCVSIVLGVVMVRITSSHDLR